jgi:putative transposase
VAVSTLFQLYLKAKRNDVGRGYKFCLVEAENYLLHLYFYIELNPVKAAVVHTQPASKWSSYHINGMGKVSELCITHLLYLAIEHSAEDRQLAY